MIGLRRDPEPCLVLQLLQSLHRLSHHVLFYNLSAPEQILAVFPESFHSSLKKMITKILLENRSAPQKPPQGPAGRRSAGDGRFELN